MKNSNKIKLYFSMIHSQKLKVIHIINEALSEEIQMLSVYLNNLNDVQIRLKALPPQKAIVDCHEKLLAKRKSN
jgi:hypothetical protein